MLNLKQLPSGMALLKWNTELPSSGTGDPLGMTLRVGARLGAELLHCITSITPRARYYSFFPWAFQRACQQAGNEAQLDQIMSLVLIDERAMTLGAVLHHEGRPCDGGALQGSNKAVEFVTNQSKRSIELSTWNHLRDNVSGFDAYKGSLINLGMFKEIAANDSEQDEEEQFGTLSSGELSEKGHQLADAFHRAVEKTVFINVKAKGSPLKLDILAEFGAAAGLCELQTAEEFDLVPLRDLFFATDIGDHHNSHFRRRMSLLLLLWAVDVTNENAVELDMQSFDDLTYYRAISDDEGNTITVQTPMPLIDISERWRIFHFHNYLTTALESLLAGLVRVIRYHPAGRTIEDIIEMFDDTTARSELGEFLSVELSSPFMDLTPIESLELLEVSFDRSADHSIGASQVFEANPIVERSLRAGLVKEDLVSGPAGPAVAVLLIYSLLLRYDLTVDEAHKGWNRKKVFHPFADVAIPTVMQALDNDFGKSWWDIPNRDVISRIMSRFVIRQHETMSYEKGFGGSPPFFRIDGARIVGTDIIRDEVYPGNPRFPSAMQILRDLQLITKDPDEGQHLTAEGLDMLASLLTEPNS